MVRVVIVANSPTLSEGLRSILDGNNSAEVVGECAGLNEAREALSRADVLLYYPNGSKPDRRPPFSEVEGLGKPVMLITSDPAVASAVQDLTLPA